MIRIRIGKEEVSEECYTFRMRRAREREDEELQIRRYFDGNESIRLGKQFRRNARSDDEKNNI